MANLRKIKRIIEFLWLGDSCKKEKRKIYLRPSLSNRSETKYPRIGEGILLIKCPLTALGSINFRSSFLQMRWCRKVYFSLIIDGSYTIPPFL